MKKMLLSVSAAILFCFNVSAMTAIGVGYQGAQSNCNIETGGNGVISNCSFNTNGTVVCSCDAVSAPVGSSNFSCNTAIGVGYQGAQSNCTIQTQGAGRISNCSFNPNGTVVCSCCD
jgi:hypothetical protein